MKRNELSEWIPIEEFLIFGTLPYRMYVLRVEYNGKILHPVVTEDRSGELRECEPGRYAMWYFDSKEYRITHVMMLGKWNFNGPAFFKVED